MSTINLLPEDYLERRAQQRANILCLILFGVIMAGLGGAAVVTEGKAQNTRVVREQVNRDYEEAGKLISEFQQLESKKKEVILKAQVAADLLERVPRSYLLACLTNALPHGASLREVTLKTTQSAGATKLEKPSKFKTNSAAKKAVAAQRMPLKVALEVTGLAQNDVQVAQFINAMSRNRLMASVDLVYSEETKYGEAVIREFQVTLVLKPDAEVDFDTQADEPPAPLQDAQAEPSKQAEPAESANEGVKP